MQLKITNKENILSVVGLLSLVLVFVYSDANSKEVRPVDTTDGPVKEEAKGCTEKKEAAKDSDMDCLYVGCNGFY
jgi:hypothetical protein